MADHHADGAVVHRVVGVGVVERRLENGGREADFVGRGIVVGVHRLGRHVPLVLVHGLAQFRNVVGRIPGVGLDDVLPVALRRVDLQRRVVLPLVGIADLHGEGREFLLRLGFRGVGHPVEGGDVLTEGRLQVLHHVEHPGLVLLGEVLGHVHLADGFRKGSVGHRHGALPAGFLLLLARHHAAEEVERRVDEVVAQVAGGCADVLCGEVVADVLQRGGFHQFVGVGQGRGGRHDDLLEIADAHCLIVLGPVDGIVGLLEIGLLRGVVHGGDVAQFDARPVFLGQLRFDRQHAGDGLVDVGLGNARQPEDFAQILLVGGADRLVLGIEVVVAVAHDQVGLRGVERVDVAVHQVGLHAHAEERIGDRGVEPGHCGGQLRAVADGENSVDGGLDRSGALGVQAHRVEPHLVEVRNLLLDASRLGFLLRHAGEQLVDALLVVVAQDVERAVARIFGLQGVVLLPAARGVLVEIGVGGYRQIEVRHVEGRGLGGILTGCHASHCCCEKNDFFHVVRDLIKRGLP